MLHGNGLPHGPERTGLWLLCLLALILAAACRGQPAAASDVDVALSIAPSPPAVGPATITVKISAAGGSPLGGAEVEIEGNMSHAGMVPVFARAAERESGVYVADRFRFTMGGDWFLTVRVALPDGRRLERTFDVRGVGGRVALPGERSPGTDH